MAEARIFQDKFSCSVCLDLLKDPVTVPCGHSYCMSCITGCWDEDDEQRVYSCPQCRKTFSPRPVLSKNVMLAELVEELKKTKLQTAHPDDCYAGPGDVECDVCTGRKYKAVKSCNFCLESYCQTHFELQEECHFGKRHPVTDATGRLQNMICSQHDRMLEVFCRTDQLCVCLLCVMHEHRNHDTVSAAAERTEKQRLLLETQRKFQQRIQEREKELQELEKAVESHKRSAQTAAEDCERIFTELISYIEKRRSEVMQLIRDQEKAAVSRAEDLLEQLKQEIDDLRRRDAELEQLSHTDDHIHFLQSLQTFSAPPECTVGSITVSSVLSFDDMAKSVSRLKEKLEYTCREAIEMVAGKVTYINITATKEPKTREQIVQYCCQFTLDLKSANNFLHLSDGNRAATNTATKQRHPDHPDRFAECYPQVLCRESVCGRSYWEVEWSGSDGVLIAVSYKSINRKGNIQECAFGCNDKSWSLFCAPSRFSVGYNNSWIDLPVSSSSCRIGVYVDHRAGTLSFYSVSDEMTLIHSIQTTFTQPLYRGYYVFIGSTMKLCLPK